MYELFFAFPNFVRDFSNKNLTVENMAQVALDQIKAIKAGHTAPFVMEQGEALRTQARLSWCSRYGSLPKGVRGYKTKYDKNEGVLMVTALPLTDDEKV